MVGKAGFIRITQLGLLRLLTNSAAMGGKPLTNDEAFRAMSAAARPSPKIWIDAYLAAAAKSNDAVLVTFDRAFASYAVEAEILG